MRGETAFGLLRAVQVVRLLNAEQRPAVFDPALALEPRTHPDGPAAHLRRESISALGRTVRAPYTGMGPPAETRAVARTESGEAVSAVGLRCQCKQQRHTDRRSYRDDDDPQWKAAAASRRLRPGAPRRHAAQEMEGGPLEPRTHPDGEWTEPPYWPASHLRRDVDLRAWCRTVRAPYTGMGPDPAETRAVCANGIRAAAPRGSFRLSGSGAGSGKSVSSSVTPTDVATAMTMMILTLDPNGRLRSMAICSG